MEKTCATEGVTAEATTVLKQLGRITVPQLLDELNKEKMPVQLDCSLTDVVYCNLEQLVEDIEEVTNGDTRILSGTYLSLLKRGKEGDRKCSNVKLYIALNDEVGLCLTYKLGQREYSSRIGLVKLPELSRLDNLYHARGDTTLQTSVCAIFLVYMVNSYLIHNYSMESSKPIHRTGFYTVEEAYREKKKKELGPICLGYKGRAERATLYNFDENTIAEGFTRVGRELRRLPAGGEPFCSHKTDEIHAIDRYYHPADCQYQIFMERISDFHHEMSYFDFTWNSEADNASYKKKVMERIDLAMAMAKKRGNSLTNKYGHPSVGAPLADTGAGNDLESDSDHEGEGAKPTPCRKTGLGCAGGAALR